MPVIKGEKTAGERFPGAVTTYTIEAMMQDRKALQAGTSTSWVRISRRRKRSNFSAESGEQEYAWTTSWGVSTRLIGGLVMTHSDDDGLVLPPKLAPAHVVILPIYRDDDERAVVLPYLRIAASRSSPPSCTTASQFACGSTTATCRGGEKKWQWVKRGVPCASRSGRATSPRER